MRILFLTHYFHPEGNAPATRVYEMCRRWVKAGHEVTVITGVPNVPNGVVYDGYRNRFRQQENVAGIRTIRVWTYLAANKGTMRRIANYLSYMFSAVLCALFVKRPDVVIATSPQFFCGWACAIVCKLRRLPFILEIRDIWPESIVAVGAMSEGRMLRFLEWLEIKLHSAADHIVTVGPGYRDRLVEKNVLPERISIIPNGVDTAMFSPREPTPGLKKEFGVENCFVCSYIGTVGMASGLDVVLRAARIFKEHGRADIRLLVVGDGAVRDDLQAAAEKNGLDNVIFTGRQPKDRIPDFLAMSDVCLVHLRKEKLFESVIPSKIYEAAAMAKPVVLGVKGRAAKLATDAGIGICIEPENAEELANVVEQLAGNVSQCHKMGLAGREMATADYDYDRLARRYMEVIHRLAG